MLKGRGYNFNDSHLYTVLVYICIKLKHKYVSFISSYILFTMIIPLKKFKLFWKMCDGTHMHIVKFLGKIFQIFLKCWTFPFHKFNCKQFDYPNYL